MTIFWKSFQNSFDPDFEEAIDQLIANSRSAPMLEDLNREVDAAKNRRHQQSIRMGYGPAGFAQVLERAGSVNKTADPEFVQACLKHLREKLDRKLTQDQFLQGCDYLDTVARQLQYKE